MIKLTLWKSKKVYTYKTKKEALREIKDNGMLWWEYDLVDTSNNTTYRNGLWLTKLEREYISSCYTYKEIRILRQLNNKKRGTKK